MVIKLFRSTARRTRFISKFCVPMWDKTARNRSGTCCQVLNSLCRRHFHKRFLLRCIFECIHCPEKLQVVSGDRLDKGTFMVSGCVVRRCIGPTEFFVKRLGSIKHSLKMDICVVEVVKRCTEACVRVEWNGSKPFVRFKHCRVFNV